MPDWTMKPYVGQQVLILLGPALLAASVYMLFGRNFRLLNTSSISPTRVNSLSKTFVPGDVISFMPEGGGPFHQIPDSCDQRTDITQVVEF